EKIPWPDSTEGKSKIPNTQFPTTDTLSKIENRKSKFGNSSGPILYLERSGEKWSVTSQPSPALKSPERYGPFKQAFHNRMLFVYGTQGSSEEKQWAFARARYDAETFWYRGNGSVDVISDLDFDPKKDPDRNVILYGNAETNRAWSALLP